MTSANISEQRLELSETSAPGPVFDPIAKTRLDRVLEDVPRSLGEVILALQNVRLEPLFEDVSAPVMTRVEALRIEPVQTVHSAGQRFSARLEEKVVVSRHQAVGVARPKKAGRRLDELHDEIESIFIASE